nr:MAG TPA: hypothetical protein [Caudoviricetes sp.]DAK79113.1 MAG TPA: hypothetical protein [Caudoviricetes sp.]
MRTNGIVLLVDQLRREHQPEYQPINRTIN